MRLSILLLVMMISACAGIQVENSLQSPKAADVARLQAMPTMDAVKEVENALVSAKRDQYDFYAPEHYRMATQALLEAKEYMVRNASHEQVVNKVAVADAVIKNSTLVVRNIKNILKDELRQKELLERANVSRHYGQEFDSLTDRLGQIIRQIENGKLAEASKQRPALKNDFDNLEMRAVVYNALHEAREIMRRVKNSGGEKLTPVTYNEAAEVLARSEQYIQSNYKTGPAVERISKEALFAAKRALYLTEEVAALSHKVQSSLEQLVLDEEYRLFRIARVLSVDDMRNNPLEVQSEIIANLVRKVAAKADEQEQLAKMYQSQLENDGEAIARISAMNDAMKDLDRERGQWKARQALYDAKVAQLEMSLLTEQAKQKTLLLEKDVLTQAFTQMSLKEQLAENARLESEKLAAQKVPEAEEKLTAVQAPEIKESAPEAVAKSDSSLPVSASDTVESMLESPVVVKQATVARPDISRSKATPVLISTPVKHGQTENKNVRDSQLTGADESVPVAQDLGPLNNAIVDLSQ